MNFTVYALLFCAAFSATNGNLSLTRISLEPPFLPNLSGDQAFLGVFIMFKLIALTVIVGLYPVVKSAILAPAPPQPPGGRRFLRETYSTLTTKQIGDILDTIYTSDENGCVVRVFCELGAWPKEHLTLNQRAIVHFVRFMPNWIPTNFQDPRYQLMAAAALGSRGGTCTGLGSTCPFDIRYLLSSLS